MNFFPSENAYLSIKLTRNARIASFAALAINDASPHWCQPSQDG
jgi:hypothetical protein